jgi:hypothetical protein
LGANELSDALTAASDGGQPGVMIMEHRIETRVEQGGVIVLSDLPFRQGETVEVVITARRAESAPRTDYPLRGKPVKLEAPFDAVAEDDWGLPS